MIPRSGAFAVVSLTTQRRAFHGSAAQAPQRPLQPNRRGILGIRLAAALDDIIHRHAKCKLPCKDVPRFQKVTKAKQCMAGWNFLQGGPHRPLEKNYKEEF